MSANTRVDRDTFDEDVADLYRNLYDLVYLRKHRLSEPLLDGTVSPRADIGWQVHKLLLDTVERLDPGPDAPAFSVPWRRYHLILSRFVDGLGPDEVARELAVSRRQFFREQKEALEALADLLWSHFDERAPEPSQQSVLPDVTDQASLRRLELLRIEAARVKRTNRSASIREVAAGVLAIMKEVFERQKIALVGAVPEQIPIVAVDPSILRQILLGVLGYMTTDVADIDISLTATVMEHSVKLAVRSEPAVLPCTACDSTMRDQFAALDEMATLSQAQLSCICDEDKLAGFDMALPVARRTVLVLDDNRDALALFTRYLESGHYRAITSSRAEEALRLARESRPDVIVLDLMMPERDGWDVLQTLLHQHETRDTPVIVCSVLNQKHLALSLGAAAFLEKPVDKQALLAMIDGLS